MRKGSKVTLLGELSCISLRKEMANRLDPYLYFYGSLEEAIEGNISQSISFNTFLQIRRAWRIYEEAVNL